MTPLRRITRDPAVMSGKPCIRGMRVTVGTVVGLLAAGRSTDEILKAYPYLKPTTSARPSPTPRGAPKSRKSLWLSREAAARADTEAVGPSVIQNGVDRHRDHRRSRRDH